VVQEGIAPVHERRRWYLDVFGLFVSGPLAFAAFSFALLFVLMPVWLLIGTGTPAQVAWLVLSAVLALLAVGMCSDVCGPASRLSSGWSSPYGPGAWLRGCCRSGASPSPPATDAG